MNIHIKYCLTGSCMCGTSAAYPRQCSADREEVEVFCLSATPRRLHITKPWSCNDYTVTALMLVAMSVACLLLAATRVMVLARRAARKQALAEGLLAKHVTG